MSKITIQKAIHKLTLGEIIIYPTEGVYGIGARADCRSAAEQIYKLKKRPIDKTFLVLVSCMSHILPWIDITDKQRQQIETTAQPTSWIVPCKNSAPDYLIANYKIGIRLTRHPVCRKLCEAIQTPLISTSANIHGKSIDSGNFDTDFPGIDIVAGSLGQLKSSTPIIDITTMDIVR